MKKIPILIIILLMGCGNPLYIQEKHFNCKSNEYKINSDLSELVFNVIKRAVVVEKDIPDYKLIGEKHSIYVLDEYQLIKIKFTNRKKWKKSLKYLQPSEIPNRIGDVNFCLKSKDELQKIADRTCEDFLCLSFGFINIEEDTAIIKIDNGWIVRKHTKTVHLSGGGYTCKYKKTNGKWKFIKIIERWIS